MLRCPLLAERNKTVVRHCSLPKPRLQFCPETAYEKLSCCVIIATMSFQSKAGSETEQVRGDDDDGKLSGAAMMMLMSP